MTKIYLRRFIKGIVLFLCFVITGPLIVLSWLEKKMSKNGEIFFQYGGQLCSLIPGKIGNLCRLSYAMGTIDKCHYSLNFFFGSYFSKREVEISPNVGIGAYCIIGKSKIHEDVRIASRVSIVSGLYEHGSTKNISANKEIGEKESIINIGKKVWIGESATIGANIGDYAIVGLGSVVLKEIPSKHLGMGNPARCLPIS